MTMARRIWHDSSGNFGIIDSDTPAALSAPTSYMDKVYFHADLDYCSILYEETQTVDLPARGAGLFAVSDYTPFSSHGLGSLPFAVMLTGTKQLPAVAMIQNDGDDIRTIALTCTTTDFGIRETYSTKAGVSALSLSIKVIAYGIAASATHTKQFHFTPADGRLRAGLGKFDTDNKYLRKVDTGTPDFYMTAGRTIDTIAVSGGDCGIRQILPNGDTIDAASYSGSFAGDGFFGVAD